MRDGIQIFLWSIMLCICVFNLIVRMIEKEQQELAEKECGEYYSIDTENNITCLKPVE